VFQADTVLKCIKQGTARVKVIFDLSLLQLISFCWSTLEYVWEDEGKWRKRG